LTLQPLPDFRGIIDDADEFAGAVDAAVASLAPWAKVDGGTVKATHGQAVLEEAAELRQSAADGPVRLAQAAPGRQPATRWAVRVGLAA
jgi:hypothetical protein